MVKTTKTDIWICGKSYGEVDGIVAWEFFGVFDDEQKAIEACTTDKHWIGPAKLNEGIPEKFTIWPGAYYPKHKLFN